MKLLLLETVALWCGLFATSPTLALNVAPTVLRPPSSSSSSTSSLSAYANVYEAAPRDISSMEQWANNCGIQRTNGFQLMQTSGEGAPLDAGVMTSQDLPANSPVLMVSNDMIMSSNQARQQMYNEDVETMITKLGVADHIPQFYLFVRILMEYERGDQSPWYPWLNSLPRSYYNGASMTPFCFECLPPLVSSLAKTDRMNFIYFKQALKKMDFLTEEIRKGKDDSIRRWAFNVVNTRSFDVGGGERRIVPMADMFNHGSSTEVAINFDQQGNCHAYTTKDVPAGSPLRRSYGDPTNPSALFATYGFLDETSPSTFCKIMDIKPTRELKDLGLDYSRMLFYTESGGISEEVWDVVLYAKVLESNTKMQRAFYQAHMNRDGSTKSAIHQQFFPQTVTALKKHVDTFLKDLDELSAKGVGKDVSEHPRLPLILRHNEFVRTTFLRVKAGLDPMVGGGGNQQQQQAHYG